MCNIWRVGVNTLICMLLIVSSVSGKNSTIERNHDPDLRELTADVDGLRELISARQQSLRELLEERDRLYKERDDARRTAVEAALAAVKEQTRASFDASEKAIVKAEEAQRTYNVAHNDLSKKLDEQNKQTMPRVEAESRFHGLEEKISELRDITGKREGKGQGYDSAWGYLIQGISMIGALLTGFGVSLFFRRKDEKQV